jgi:hypothetical protein
VEPLLDKEVHACRSSKRRHGDGSQGLRLGARHPLARRAATSLEAGESEAVLDLRRLWRKVVRTSCSRAIEELTGGQVVGFMSDDHIDSDIAAGVLTLEPVGADPVAQPAIAVVDRAPG